jgi:aspartate/methionine/tyrosine aminotransferase
MDVMRVANERAAAGAEVLHLEVGQPGTPAPARVIEAAARAAARERLGYTDALGLPELRARIAESYRALYGVSVDPSRVVVTTGSSGAFLLGFLAAFDPGDRVALTVPGYPAYRNILAAVGIEPVLLPSESSQRFQPTVELLEAVSGRLDGLIVASPSNPTGTMLGRQELRSLADYCAARGTRLVSDEIYHGITYGAPADTALQFTDEAIIVNSFSKYFSMTGWRLGWMVVPPPLLRSIECLAQNLFISPPTLSQHAALAAFGCRDELDGYVARYARNRSLLLELLPEAGLHRLAPADGAFYLYADVGHLTNDSESFCRRMLTQAGVATTPGIDFDHARGHRFVRLSFAGSEQDIAAAGERLKAWLSGG